jgi:hypothetical protein
MHTYKGLLISAQIGSEAYQNLIHNLYRGSEDDHSAPPSAEVKNGIFTDMYKPRTNHESIQSMNSITCSLHFSTSLKFTVDVTIIYKFLFSVTLNQLYSLHITTFNVT